MAPEENRYLSELTRKQSLIYAEDLTKTYRELRKRIDELEILNQKKKDFLIMASHEIRTPITKMSFMVDFIKERLDTADAADNSGPPEELKTILKQLRRTAWSLHTIMSEVILAAQQDRKEVPYNFSKLDIVSFIEELVDEISPFLRRRKQEIVTEFRDKDLIVKADKLRLFDVVFNLVQNASRFSEDGKNIFLRTWKKDDMAVIAIEDQGIGIEKKKLDAVFTPFYEDIDIMAHKSGTFEFKSSRLGMGLYIARHIVEAHGGSITVQSTPGEGSIFSIYLLTGHDDATAREDDNKAVL